MKLSNSLKQILNDNRIITSINKYDFRLVYLYIKSMTTDAKDIRDFTELCLESGINPLDYMDYVPEYFLCYSNINSFDIPNNIASIGENAFQSCKLNSITIPDSVIRIGKEAFMDCTNLNYIKLPKNLKALSHYCFYGCSNLNKIDIPVNLNAIGKLAFHKCDNLTDIYYQGTKEQFAELMADNPYTTGLHSNCIIHCTDGDLKSW